MRADITASSASRNLSGIPVLNPGEWYGKAWLFGNRVGYSVAWYVVEADTLCDAIDIFVESNEGAMHRLDPADLASGDWGPDGEDAQWTGQSIPYDTEWMCMYDAPPDLMYHVPARVIRPQDYNE